jgi:hypothetical protein
LVLWHAGVALDHGALDLYRAPHRIDDAAEFNDRAVPRALDDPAVMYGDRRVDKVAAQCPEPGEDTILVGAGKATVAL